jgi:hypothetical protein
LNRREFPKELQEYYRDFEGSYRLPATPSKETKETAWFSHTYSGRDENCVKMAEYIRPWKNRRALESDRWWGYADFERIYVVGTGSDAERIARALRLGKCRNLKGILKEDDALPYEKGTLLIAASRKKDIPVVSEYLAHREKPEHPWGGSLAWNP